MEQKISCDFEGCLAIAVPAHSIYGKNYCLQHYDIALERAFLKEYEAWKGGDPSKKFKNVFARFVDSIYKGQMQESLSKGRLEDRTFNLTKTKDGLRFSIIRHLNAWSRVEPMKEAQERYTFSINKRELKLLGRI